MGIIFSIFLIVVGGLAAYPKVVQTWPNGKELIDKLLPYQGTIGVVALAWGLIGVLMLLFSHMHIMLTYFPVGWLIWMAAYLDAVLLGLLLGYALIAQYVLARNLDLQRRAETIRAKLTPRQIQLGIAGMVLGVLGFILHLGM
jgi:hypothetical protein